MLTFQNYYSLNENRFRQRKNQAHIIDLPMFSVFVGENAMESYSQNENEYKENLKKACAEARNKIHKLGFPSMHANILIKDLSDKVNQNTEGGVAGFAYRKGKYMEVDKKYVEVSSDYLVNIIVHEWAHLWMFNNSKQFKRAVYEYYKLLKNYALETSPKQLSKNESGELQRKIFEDVIPVWKEAIKYITSSNGIFKNEIDDIIIKKKAIGVKDFEKIPNQFTIYGLADRDITLEHYSGDKRTMRKGEEISVQKFYDAWLVYHYDQRNTRWETRINKNVSLEELGVLQDPATRFEKTLDDYAQRISLPNTKEFKERIYNYVNRAFEEITDRLRRKFNTVSRYEENEQLISQITNYIWKKFSAWLKSKSMKKVDDPYQTFWVYNQYKPESFSILELFANQIIEKKLKNIEMSPSIAGKDYDQIRENLKTLVKWTDSYGMSNDDELWATGIEQFLDLPYQHRRKIVELMGTR
jgi:hypothetical protein